MIRAGSYQRHSRSLPGVWWHAWSRTRAQRTCHRPAPPSGPSSTCRWCRNRACWSRRAQGSRCRSNELGQVQTRVCTRIAQRRTHPVTRLSSLSLKCCWTAVAAPTICPPRCCPPAPSACCAATMTIPQTSDQSTGAPCPRSLAGIAGQSPAGPGRCHVAAARHLAIRRRLTPGASSVRAPDNRRGSLQSRAVRWSHRKPLAYQRASSAQRISVRRGDACARNS